MIDWGLKDEGPISCLHQVMKSEGIGTLSATLRANLSLFLSRIEQLNYPLQKKNCLADENENSPITALFFIIIKLEIIPFLIIHRQR